MDESHASTPVTIDPLSLRALSDNDLARRTDDLVRRERLTTLEILFHLGEVDRRRLWRTLEYRSLFDYCIRRLRYSEGAAARRIRVARLIARHPQVCGRIRDGRLSLCAVSKIAAAVLDDGRVDLLAAVEGKRLDQVDAIIATHRNPTRPVRESIRLVCVERRLDPPSRPELTVGSDADAPGHGPTADTRPTPAGSPPAGLPATPNPIAGLPARDAAGRTRIERVFRLQFGIDAETMAKFSRVQSIAATRNGRHVDLSELFGTLCDVYLDRHDAVRRAQRRERRRGAGARTIGKGDRPERRADTRRVPQGTRDEVFRRDGGRCTFVDKDGVRCTETLNLHVDHVRPFALGGSSEPTNLRLMCPAHNRLLAERTFGRRAVAGFDERP